MQLKKHIILVGFMCSGKTTYGKILSNALNIPFIDIDEYISIKYNNTISAIFEEQGEDFFRDLEYKSLKEVLMLSPRIIATGGGTPCFNNTISLMNDNGLTVYLEADADTLFKWIKEGDIERPLLKGKIDDELFKYISNLLEQRKPFYQKSYITISAKEFNSQKFIDYLNLMIKRGIL